MDTLALQGAPAGPWGRPRGTGTSLCRLTPPSPPQRDELGGLELAETPLPSEPPAPRHKGSLVGASPAAAPAGGKAGTNPPCTEKDGEDTRVAPAQSERAWGAACPGFGVLWFWGTPAAPPNPLCCCPRATTRPQELVACAVAPWLPKPAPSTLQRVYCWHEHSDLLGQSSPALG